MRDSFRWCRQADELEEHWEPFVDRGLFRVILTSYSDLHSASWWQVSPFDPLLHTIALHYCNCSNQTVFDAAWWTLDSLMFVGGWWWGWRGLIDPSRVRSLAPYPDWLWMGYSYLSCYSDPSKWWQDLDYFQIVVHLPANHFFGLLYLMIPYLSCFLDFSFWNFHYLNQQYQVKLFKISADLPVLTLYLVLEDLPMIQLPIHLNPPKHSL